MSERKQPVGAWKRPWGVARHQPLPGRVLPGPAQRQRGAALLLVVGATAALAVLVSSLLVNTLAAHEAMRVRIEHRQAEALAQAALQQAVAALGSGLLAPPVPGREVIVRNGALHRSGARVPVGVFPRPAVLPGDGRLEALPWPPVTAAFWMGNAPSGGVGVQVQLHAVVGPGGEARGATAHSDGSRLIEIVARAWFRRAQAQAMTRVLVQPPAPLRRLN